MPAFIRERDWERGRLALVRKSIRAIAQLTILIGEITFPGNTGKRADFIRFFRHDGEGAVVPGLTPEDEAAGWVDTDNGDWHILFPERKNFPGTTFLLLTKIYCSR